MESFRTIKIKNLTNKSPSLPKQPHSFHSINKTLKHFDLLISQKEDLLEEQKLKVRNTSFKLKSRIQLKRTKEFTSTLKKKLMNKQNLAAVKIQKVFRGHLSRKKNSCISLKTQKIFAYDKIKKLKESIDSLFYLSAASTAAASKIQKAFRLYRKRKILYFWIDFWKKLKAAWLKQKIRVFLKFFLSKQELAKARFSFIQNNMIRQIKENHAFSVISKCWKSLNLSLEKVLTNIRKIKIKSSEEKTNQKGEKNDLHPVFTRRQQLPYLSIVPARRAIQFVNTIKRPSIQSYSPTRQVVSLPKLFK